MYIGTVIRASSAVNAPKLRVTHTTSFVGTKKTTKLATQVINFSLAQLIHNRPVPYYTWRISHRRSKVTEALKIGSVDLTTEGLSGKGDLATIIPPVLLLIYQTGRVNLSAEHFLQQLLCWSVVLVTASSLYKNTSSVVSEVFKCSSATLALALLNFSSLDLVSGAVFGILLSGFVSVHKAVVLATLALATWQGYTFAWIVAAYGICWGQKLVEGARNGRVHVLGALNILISLAALGSTFARLPFDTSAQLWTVFIVIGFVASNLITCLKELAD
mmetsp:Transcript_1722/g.4029  ORF Transcript_1722/g.4029 Transcript_1722/m.4029 type:complete len:274 (+) Transcript_1722:179-1000(+)